jgi:catechol 2,3-dioxygenase-like lactoylglutathione lyase family enzyme
MHLMNLSHVGIVVPNVEEARDHFAELLGIEWGPIREARVPVNGGDGDGHETLRVCFSISEPGIELLEQVPGTVWSCNGYSNLHHLSFTVDFVLDESRRLDAALCPLEYLIPATDGSATLAYHRDALGVRLELVSVGARPHIEPHHDRGNRP